MNSADDILQPDSNPALYVSSVLNPEKVDAELVIGELFSLWMKHPDMLPYHYREKSGQEELPRVICDYIAGMTDSYIYEQYEKYVVNKA